jgi:hypothetical protein
MRPGHTNQKSETEFANTCPRALALAGRPRFIPLELPRQLKGLEQIKLGLTPNFGHLLF